MAHRTSTSNTPLPLDYHTDDAEAFHLLSLPLFQGLSQSDLLRMPKPHRCPLHSTHKANVLQRRVKPVDS